MAVIEKIQKFKRAESIIGELLDASYAISSSAIPIAQVKGAFNDYLRDVNTILSGNEEFAKVAIQAIGSDVIVPDIHQSHDGATVTYAIDQENAQRPLFNFESATGLYHSIAVRALDQTGQDSVDVEPIMLIASKPESVDISLGVLPLVEHGRIEYVHVPLRKDADVEISTVGMNLIRKHSAAINTLSQNGLRRSLYVKKTTCS